MRAFTSPTDPLVLAAQAVIEGNLNEADPANLRSIITNHTALLKKADKPEAREFHKTAIANAKEKLQALGEELDEAMTDAEKAANRKIVRRAKVDAKINASAAEYAEKKKKRNAFDGGPNIKIKVEDLEELDEAVEKIACAKCDEVNTKAAWKKNHGFCPSCKVSSQGFAESVEELDESTLIQKNTAKLENMLSVLRDDLNPARSSYVRALVSDHPEAKEILAKAFKKIQEVEGLFDDILELEVKKNVKDQSAAA